MPAISILEPRDAPAYRSLAFPRHEPLLVHDLGASGTTVAAGAWNAGAPRGLALAGPTGGEVAALHAVVVSEDARRQGVATRLLEALESTVRLRGVRRLVASVRGNRPHSDAVSRLLARRQFEPVRSVVEIVYPIARLLHAPALAAPCRGAAVVACTPERMAPLLGLSDPSGMAPANVAPEDNDPELATLIARDDIVAGCVLGRRITADTVYMSLLFVRPELRRSQVAAFAVRQFLHRMIERGFERLSCEVSVDNSACLALADIALGEYAEHRAVVHVVEKSLA